MSAFRNGLVAAIGLVALAGDAIAQDYPSQPLTIIVGFDAGGSVDRMARGLAAYLPEYLGQPVVVENRPGAGGQVGTSYFLAQPADGYTLMISPATPYIVNNILVTGASYTLDDFAFINAQWSDFTFLAVPNDRPWTTAQALIDAIKAEPGRLSAGVTFGSAGHITTVALLEALGLGIDSVRLVTFDGGGPLRTALAGGQVDFSIVQAEGSETIVDLIRPLAVFTAEPQPGFEAPVVRDALRSYGIEVPLLSGSVRTLIAPASFRDDRPEDYRKLVAAYQTTLENPDYRAWLTENQMGGDWVGPEETEAVIRENFDILSQYSAFLKQ